LSLSTDVIFGYVLSIGSFASQTCFPRERRWMKLVHRLSTWEGMLLLLSLTPLPLREVSLPSNHLTQGRRETAWFKLNHSTMSSKFETFFFTFLIPFPHLGNYLIHWLITVAILSPWGFPLLRRIELTSCKLSLDSFPAITCWK
jgi:hypothetical protein